MSVRKSESSKNITAGCPFQARRGYATHDTQQEYLQQNEMEESSLDLSLIADTDQTKPLHFWQLYSLIGKQPILDIVTDFYKRVFEDDEDWQFRHAFVGLAPVEHHVATQAAFWIDAMGGGKVYHGGNYRLRFHHFHNAKEVMNAEGARRWMFHMRAALQAYDFSRFKDDRILPCIMGFLKTKMYTYSCEFGWEFDQSDFDEIEQTSVSEVQPKVGKAGTETLETVVEKESKMDC